MLRIPAIQSPNYLAGVSGWIIKQDGSAEFNSVVVRGSLVTGTAGGARVEIGTIPGEIDFYDSANNLVMTMGAPSQPGGIYQEKPGTHETVFINAGSVFLYKSTLSDTPAAIQFVDGGAGDDQLQLSSGFEAGGSSSVLTLHADPSNTGAGYITAHQRGVTGTLMQTDASGVASNNLVHTVRKSFTTNGSGDGSFNPTLGFTPTACQVTMTGLSFTVPGTQIVVWRDLMTATNIAFRVFSPGGAAFVGTMTADFTFFG